MKRLAVIGAAVLMVGTLAILPACGTSTGTPTEKAASTTQTTANTEAMEGVVGMPPLQPADHADRAQDPADRCYGCHSEPPARGCHDHAGRPLRGRNVRLSRHRARSRAVYYLPSRCVRRQARRQYGGALAAPHPSSALQSEQVRKSKETIAPW